MGLTTAQRNRLPDSAFLDPARRRFPVISAANARKAGISLAQATRTNRNALARAGQQTKRRGVKKITPAMARRAVKARAGGRVASVKTTRAPKRKASRRRTRRRRG